MADSDENNYKSKEELEQYLDEQKKQAEKRSADNSLMLDKFKDDLENSEETNGGDSDNSSQNSQESNQNGGNQSNNDSSQDENGDDGSDVEYDAVNDGKLNVEVIQGENYYWRFFVDSMSRSFIQHVVGSVTTIPQRLLEASILAVCRDYTKGWIENILNIWLDPPKPAYILDVEACFNPSESNNKKAWLKLYNLQLLSNFEFSLGQDQANMNMNGEPEADLGVVNQNSGSITFGYYNLTHFSNWGKDSSKVDDFEKFNANYLRANAMGNNLNSEIKLRVTMTPSDAWRWDESRFWPHLKTKQKNSYEFSLINCRPKPMDFGTIGDDYTCQWTYTFDCTLESIKVKGQDGNFIG